MGSGTDVARESADVVLLGNDLLKFVETCQVARRSRRIIWFNFGSFRGNSGRRPPGFPTPMIPSVPEWSWN
jgi:hypothetical protein